MVIGFHLLEITQLPLYILNLANKSQVCPILDCVCYVLDPFHDKSIKHLECIVMLFHLLQEVIT